MYLYSQSVRKDTLLRSKETKETSILGTFLEDPVRHRVLLSHACISYASAT